jgi:hypothetical protein
MSEQVLRAVVERMAADRAFAALVEQNPDAALAAYDLTEEERAAVLALGDDATGGAHPLAPRVTKSSLVFGHLGRGVDHLGDTHPAASHDVSFDVGVPAHGAVDGGWTPGFDAAGTASPALAHGSGVDIFEGPPSGWSLPDPGVHAGAGLAGLSGSPWEHGGGLDPASLPTDVTAHGPLWDASAAPGTAGDIAVWHLPEHGQGGDAVLGGGAPVVATPSALDGAGGEVERIPGVGQLFAAGLALGEAAGHVPGDVLDTFGSLGHSVVSSMTTAITTSVSDGFSVAATPVRYIEDIRW